MNKLFLSSLITICSINAYELNFSKEFSLNVSPDILSSYISITYENKNESQINDKLEEFNEFFKDQEDIIKKNGRFNLNPKYRYKNGKQKFLGYKGNLSYTIQSKDVKRFNTFLSDLIKLKKDISTTKIKLTIGNISWKISPEQNDINIDNLRKISIAWIKDYKQTISDSCKILQINMGNNYSFNNQPVYTMRSDNYTSISSVKNISPINSNKKITLNVNYKLECR